MLTISRRVIDITYQRFGRLVVLSPHSRVSARQKIAWLCQCDCGNTAVVMGEHLRSGHTQSCGCLQSDVTTERNMTHGMADDGLYATWGKMNQRCVNPNTPRYERYGGRGIAVCDEWKVSFPSFLAYVSQLPHYGEEGYTLDRTDNDGNYEPGNVRWASPTEQSRNRSDNILITYNGTKKCLAEWAKDLGFKYSTLRARIVRYGWNTERAFAKPVRGKTC